MHLLQNISRYCPYCGELIDFLIDCSIEQQQYTEDCQVCCRPIIVTSKIEEGKTISLSVNREDD